MGTRSNVRIFDEEGKILVTLYRQFDGDPEGMGLDLFNFLRDGIIVNGIGKRDQRYFSGMNDLAAQVIAFLKTDEKTKEITIGNLYVYPLNHIPGSSDERYLYDIKFEEANIILSGYSIDYNTLETHLLFKGIVSELSKKIICGEGDEED